MKISEINDIPLINILIEEYEKLRLDELYLFNKAKLDAQVEIMRCAGYSINSYELYKDKILQAEYEYELATDFSKSTSIINTLKTRKMEIIKSVEI